MTTTTLTTAQTWTVPVGVTSVYVVCRAANGQTTSRAGGLGGLVRGTLNVTPGQVLTFALLPGGAGGGSEGSPAYAAGIGGSGVYFGPAFGSDLGLYAGGGGGSGAASGDDPDTYPGGQGGNGGGSSGVGEQPHYTALNRSGAGGALGSAAGQNGSAGGNFVRGENEYKNGGAGGGGGGGYRGGGGGGYGYTLVSDFPAAGGGGGGGGSNFTGPDVVGGESLPANSNTDTASVELTYSNPAPSAPLLTYPTGNVVLDRALTHRLSWTHSDTGSDPQSKYDLRYRAGGAWTDVSGVTANAFHDIAGGTLAAGAYEWQVRTYDSIGQPGLYSGSEFFTAASVPAGPTITDPVNGSTIAAASQTVTWSHPDQDAYQLRTVADSSGTPDTSTVYSDSGVVESTLTRTRLVAFPVNDRDEHVQVRVRKTTLWSAWTSARYTIDYTPPAASTVTLLASDATGSIDVVLTPATPGSGEPTVVATAVEVEALTGRDTTRPVGTVVRLVEDLPASDTWTDWAPASGVEYRYRAVVTGSNGAQTTGPWTDVFVDDFSDLFTDLYV